MREGFLVLDQTHKHRKSAQQLPSYAARSPRFWHASRRPTQFYCSFISVSRVFICICTHFLCFFAEVASHNNIKNSHAFYDVLFSCCTTGWNVKSISSFVSNINFSNECVVSAFLQRLLLTIFNSLILFLFSCTST
jgi:hypothetical protein